MLLRIIMFGAGAAFIGGAMAGIACDSLDRALLWYEYVLIWIAACGVMELVAQAPTLGG